MVLYKPSQNKAEGETAQSTNFAQNYWAWQVNDYGKKGSSKYFYSLQARRGPSAI